MEILVRGHAKKKTLKLISEVIDQVYGLDFKEVSFFFQRLRKNDLTHLIIFSYLQ